MKKGIHPENYRLVAFTPFSKYEKASKLKHSKK